MVVRLIAGFHVCQGMKVHQQDFTQNDEASVESTGMLQKDETPLATYAYNFREVTIGHVTFGAMAHPVRYAYDEKGSDDRDPNATPGVYLKKMFKRAKAEQYTVMINFDDDNTTEMENIWTKESIGKSLMKALGLRSPRYHYYRFPVRDFHAPKHSVVNAFIALVKKLPAGTRIIAHCGEGYGRTGIMLAAMQLQHQFDVIARDPARVATLADIWGDGKPSKTNEATMIKLGHYARANKWEGSAQTFNAVAAVRAAENGVHKDSPGMAVEKEVQVDFLNRRCEMLAKEAQNIVAEL
jgi:hypothetical protein